MHSERKEALTTKSVKEFLNTYSADTIVNPATGRSYWFKENRIPRLGEVRGRIVLLRKFAYSGDAKAGIDLTPWNSPECSNKEYCEVNLDLTDDTVSRRLCLEDAYKQYSMSGKWPPVRRVFSTNGRPNDSSCIKDFHVTVNPSVGGSTVVEFYSKICLPR